MNDRDDMPRGMVEGGGQTELAESHQVFAESASRDDVLTADSVAALLHTDRKTVYAAAHRGELPCLRLGRVFRFSRRAVLNSLSQGRVAPQAEGGK